ncbi:hypothetical protein TIFTF001_022017 [Ficus carica]|uniref:Shugoshin C-terminal domain-containing protein n=1 Tax=Ficus carica TaxID=3494 RepID=A0AA88AVD0_FICCA|nr:hypothetical protein TIFTF001_022017 [Ficus carica]
MDTVIHVHSDNFSVGDGKTGVKIGGAQRKMLSDISNLQSRAKLTNPDAKNKATTITTKEYVERLQKENAELAKLLADRNKLIELSMVELRKLRVNLQKVQQQNVQLAQANSQMLAELNSGKDRLKVLQHELGCKNGQLKARKLEAGERWKRVTCQNTNNEVGSSHYDESGEPSQTDKENKPSNANQRKQSRNQSLGRHPVKASSAKEEVNKKRSCSRRQSARLKSKESVETEDVFEIDNAEFPVSSMHDDLIEASDQALLESSMKKEDENAIHVSEDLGPPAVKAVDETKKKRCSRRQSARFKTKESEATEDSFEIDDDKFHVSSHHDDAVDAVGASGQTFLGLSVENEDQGNATTGSGDQELRRSSVGRPMRRAAEKIQSYKEIPINVKMRRVE